MKIIVHGEMSSDEMQHTRDLVSLTLVYLPYVTLIGL